MKDASNTPMLNALRGLLKTSGLTQKDVADHLEVSVDTVKRLLSGKIPITLDRITEICEMLKIDVYELARISKFGQKPPAAFLSLEQEKTMASDDGLFAIFYLVVMGLSFDDILKDYKFSKETILKHALKLESLGILELHPKNKMKMLVYRKIRWSMNGPLHNKYMVPWAADFASQVYQAQESFKFFFNCPVSEDSKQQILMKIRELCREIEHMSEMDLNVSHRVDESINIFIGAKHWMPDVIRGFKR